MSEHWTVRAIERGSWRVCWGHDWLLGEDERGDLCIPRGRDVWRGRYDRRNPTHWPFWLHSRLRRRIVWVETMP